jgi:hypothetical protein
MGEETQVTAYRTGNDEEDKGFGEEWTTNIGFLGKYRILVEG